MSDEVTSEDIEEQNILIEDLKDRVKAYDGDPAHLRERLECHRAIKRELEEKRNA